MVKFNYTLITLSIIILADNVNEASCSGVACRNMNYIHKQSSAACADNLTCPLRVFPYFVLCFSLRGEGKRK